MIITAAQATSKFPELASKMLQATKIRIENLKKNLCYLDLVALDNSSLLQHFSDLSLLSSQYSKFDKPADIFTE